MGYIGAGVTRFNTADELTVTGDAEFNGNATFGDNDKVTFGDAAGGDLQIYHDAGNSRIVDAGTGNLNLQADNNVNILNNAGTEFKAQFITDGAVNLFYDNSKKFETTSGGIDVTGTVTADGLTVDVPSGNGAINFNVTDGNQASFIFKEANVQKWNVASVGSDDRFQIYNYNINGFGQTIAANNDVSFYDSTGVTQGLFWDSSTQNLGIKTTTPDASLQIGAGARGASSATFRPTVLIGDRPNADGNANLEFSPNLTTGNAVYMSVDTSKNLKFGRVDSGTFTETVRIDSSGNVGIGTTSPTSALDVKSADDVQIEIENSGGGGGFIGVDSSNVMNIGRSGPVDLAFKTNNTERLRIDSSGNVGIGTTSPDSPLHVIGDGKFKATGETKIRFQNDTTGTGSSDGCFVGLFNGSDGMALFNYEATPMRFFTSNAERMRIDSSGRLLVGTTDTALYNNTSGNGFIYDAASGSTQMLREGNVVLLINRASSDGTLVTFYQDGAAEGSISVSGSTVSYNGGHLARWSQASDGNRIDGLVKGTVMTNLDQMAVWHHEAQPATYYEEGDELPEGVSVGDEKTPAVAAYDEDNEQLNCMAVSSVEGDANVAGVFVNWDDDDEDYTADMNIAMTGDMVIRIAQGTTVARGDLLMSAGDGTAKPQGDDIVRSKTIAKVTSTTVSHTYDDGSYLVPCVLMAC